MIRRRELLTGCAALAAYRSLPADAQTYRPGGLLRPPGFQFLNANKLFLDFTNGTIPSGVTGTGANGTTVNASGLVTPQSAPRLTYDGATAGKSSLLVEGASTNGLFPSVIDTSYATSAVTLNVNNTTSPDSSTTAALITGTSTSAAHNIVSATYPFVSGTKYYVSAFFRAGTNGFAQIASGIAFTSAVVNVNLNTGATAIVGTGATATSSAYTDGAGNTWWRVTLVATASSSSSTGINYGLANSLAYARYGAFVATGLTMYVWGAEIKTDATSYIPTTTATVTRTTEGDGFTIPAGVSTLTYTFDDGSTQVVSASPGAYTIPTNLNRPRIATIVGN